MNDILYNSNALAIFPNIRGFGYAFFIDDLSPKYYGMIGIRPTDNLKCIRRISEMVKMYEPKIILLPSPDLGRKKRHKRIDELIFEIIEYAKDNGIQIRTYSREQIRMNFEQFDAFTKLEIAEKICIWMPDLLKYKPAKKKSYMPEDYYQGMFDAISLFITHMEVTR